MSEEKDPFHDLDGMTDEAVEDSADEFEEIEYTVSAEDYEAERIFRPYTPPAPNTYFPVVVVRAWISQSTLSNIKGMRQIECEMDHLSTKYGDKPYPYHGWFPMGEVSNMAGTKTRRPGRKLLAATGVAPEVSVGGDPASGKITKDMVYKRDDGQWGVHALEGKEIMAKAKGKPGKWQATFSDDGEPLFVIREKLVVDDSDNFKLDENYLPIPLKDSGFVVDPEKGLVFDENNNIMMKRGFPRDDIWDMVAAMPERTIEVKGARETRTLTVDYNSVSSLMGSIRPGTVVSTDEGHFAHYTRSGTWEVADPKRVRTLPDGALSLAPIPASPESGNNPGGLEDFAPSK